MFYVDFVNNNNIFWNGYNLELGNYLLMASSPYEQDNVINLTQKDRK
jgi:hypothetical protein